MPGMHVTVVCASAVLSPAIISDRPAGTGFARQYQDKSTWFELGCKDLARRFDKGMQFIVVTPAFQTLRQQTFDRIVKAKLAEACDSHVVIPTIWASKVCCSSMQHRSSHCVHLLLGL